MKKNKNIVILDKPQTNGVIGNYNLEEVPIYGWNIASPKQVYSQQILNDLALQDLMAKRSSWTENPIVGPAISIVPKDYVDPASVYNETLNTTGDIFAAITARDNARISNKNIDENLANWALAKQFAQNAITPTKGLNDDLNNIGLATGIGMFSPFVAHGAAHMIPTTAQGWLGLGLGVAGSQAVDRVIRNTSDYNSWTDMMLDKTKDWGNKGDFSRAVGDLIAYVGNPGGLLGGFSAANFSDDIAHPVINNSIKPANLILDDLIPKQQVAIATPEGYVVKVPAKQAGIEMTSNKLNWGNWPWSKPTATPAAPVAPEVPAAKTPAAKIDGTKYTLGPKNRFLVERGVEIDPKFKSTLKKSMKDLSDVEKEKFAVAAREYYEKTLEPVNEYNFDLIKTRAGERAKAYEDNLTILRGKHIDEFGIEMPSTDKQIKAAQQAIKTRNSEINYRDPAAKKLNWFTHPITNIFSPKPVGWSQNNPTLSNLEKWGFIGLETMLPSYYGRQIIGMAPEGIEWWVSGPDENKTESKENKQNQTKPEPIYNSASLKEMIKWSDEQSKIDSLNNTR